MKLHSFCTAKDEKDNPQNGRKYLQMKQLTKDLSPEYTNSSCSSISKKQKPNQKKGRRPK